MLHERLRKYQVTIVGKS